MIISLFDEINLFRSLPEHPLDTIERLLSEWKEKRLVPPIGSYNEPISEEHNTPKHSEYPQLPQHPEHLHESNPRTKKKCLKRVLQPQTDQENVLPKKPYAKTEKMPSPAVRFDHSLPHFPLIEKNRLVRCKNEDCHNKKSYVSCKVCEVHLCLNVAEERNCFTNFHMIGKKEDWTLKSLYKYSKKELQNKLYFYWNER